MLSFAVAKLTCNGINKNLIADILETKIINVYGVVLYQTYNFCLKPTISLVFMATEMLNLRKIFKLEFLEKQISAMRLGVGLGFFGRVGV